MNLRQIVCRTGLLVACVMPALAVQAMEQMDDHQMAASTGQDGISIGIQLPQSTFAFDQIQLVNVDNRAVPTSGRAALVLAMTNVSATNGIRFLRSIAADTAATTGFVLKIDADGNGAAPTLNANFALPTDLARIQVSPFSVYLADGNTNIFANRATSTLRSDVYEILRVGGTGLQIKLKPNDAAAFNPIAFNLQFGNEPQGHMLQVTSGALYQITAPIELISNNVLPAANSSLRFDLDISATNQVTGFLLNGFYADIDADGLVFGNSGTTDKLNVQLNNVTAGTLGAGGISSPTVFNGTVNGALGNFGVQGLQIENLRVNVSGM